MINKFKLRAGAATLSLAVSMAGSFAAPAQAEDAAEGTGASTIVVTATSREQEVKDAPAGTPALSRSDRRADGDPGRYRHPR